MADYPLDTFQQATVDASGIATTLGIGPVRYGETWDVGRWSVSLTEGRGECRVYRGAVSPTRQLDVTTSGEGDTSENNSITLQTGERIIAQWTEATPGAIGVVTFGGTIHIRRR
jgi:hypothetical protein